MTLPRIIAFAGKKRSGKTLLANECKKYGYNIINFADKLKEITCNVLNISNDHLDINKDIYQNDIYINELSYNYIANEIGVSYLLIKEKLYKKKFNYYREILQFIGTDIIRDINKNWHLENIEKIIKNNKNNLYCIGDLRFKNEKELIEELNGECWYIERENNSDNENLQHLSENSLNKNDFNNIIYNNKSKNDFINEWDMYIKSKLI